MCIVAAYKKVPADINNAQATIEEFSTLLCIHLTHIRIPYVSNAVIGLALENT